MSKVTKLVVGKGRTTRPSEQEEWLKEYYELEIELGSPSDLEVAKANALGVLDGWLSKPSGTRPTEQKEALKIPDVDLHKLEHDEAWRSWRKDEKNQCTFPAKEGQAGWVRIKNAGDTVLRLVKAMKKQNLSKVSLGLFEYKFSGEDFLQRRPLKKAEDNPHGRMDRNLRNIKVAGEKLTQN